MLTHLFPGPPFVTRGPVELWDCLPFLLSLCRCSLQVLRDTSMMKRGSFWALEEDQGQLQIQAEPYILPSWFLPLLITSTPSSSSPQIQLCILLHPCPDSNHLPGRSQEQKDYTLTQVNLKYPETKGPIRKQGVHFASGVLGTPVVF